MVGFCHGGNMPASHAHDGEAITHLNQPLTYLPAENPWIFSLVLVNLVLNLEDCHQVDSHEHHHENYDHYENHHA